MKLQPYGIEGCLLRWIEAFLSNRKFFVRVGKIMLSFKNRILTFGTRNNLDLLKEFTHWSVDGTFKACPGVFYQIFVIHAFIDLKALPMLYALLPKKRQNIYVEPFESLKTLDQALEPVSVIVDFEQASINAKMHVFPNTRIVGCAFYVAQICGEEFNKMVELSCIKTTKKFDFCVKCYLG
jgi:hypothetical protein